MKIKFEWNEKMKETKPKDFEEYKKAMNHLENLDDKEVHLLKDDRTNFTSRDPRFAEDIKSVFILVNDKSGKFKIKIKGNLSFYGRDNEIRFYPIFINQFGNFDENGKYWYKFDLSKVDDPNVDSYDRGQQNKKIYLEMIKEFKSSKYTPAVAMAEWKDFIEPYEYYVDLKFQLLKQDFLMLENFERDIKRVIILDNKNKQFKNFLENELYDELYEDNRKTLMMVDYSKHRNSFDNDFLKKNTFYIATSKSYFDKDERKDAEFKASILNAKLKTNLSKSTFFTTDNRYTTDDLRKDGRMSANDIELDTEQAYVADFIEEYSIIENGSSKFKGIQDSLINIKSEKLSFKSIDSIISKLLKIDERLSDFDKFSKITKNDFNSKMKLIVDEDIEYVNEVIYEIDNIKLNSLKEEIEKIKSLREKLKIEIENLENDSITKGNKLTRESEIKLSNLNEDDKEIAKKIRKDLKDKLNEINSNYEIEKQNIFEINEKALSKFINEKVNLAIEENFKSLEKLLNVIKSGIARTVTYIQEIKIIFNFKNDDENRIKKNFYVLNTGDMVLVDTIRRINTKIKKGQEMNSDILFKIIRKEKMKIFNDPVTPGEIENKFLPKEYNNLNPSQQKAFRLAIDTTDPISIIQGPPGTGKTEVITNIIKYYRNKGEKVILSSQTNVAIKNVLDKLCSHNKISNSVIIPWLTTKSKEDYSKANLDSTWYKKIIKNIYESNMDFVKQWESKLNELSEDTQILSDIILSRDVKAFAATTTTSVTLPGRGYDDHLKDVKVLIIDEVSKSILPEILRYALDVKKVILVGDYKQLNPIFDIREDSFDKPVDPVKFKKLKKEIQEGIFYNLAKDAKSVNRIATLDINYRSVPGVLDAYNVFYNEGGRQEGLTGFRKFSEYSKNYKFSNSEFFDSDHSMYFIDVQGAKEEKQGTSRYNRGEIKALIKAMWDLANNLENVNDKEVAIIFPYAAQIRRFSDEIRKKSNSELRSKFKDVQWDTVDSFQGSEADIVFLSTVVTDANSNNFLSDFRRINVSMSRAKDMLVVLGNGHVIKNIEVGGEGITPGKYFTKILDDRENEYLKIIKVKETGE